MPEVAEILADPVPGTRIESAEGAGRDKRCCQVDSIKSRQ